MCSHPYFAGHRAFVVQARWHKIMQSTDAVSRRPPWGTRKYFLAQLGMSTDNGHMPAHLVNLCILHLTRKVLWNVEEKKIEGSWCDIICSKELDLQCWVCLTCFPSCWHALLSADMHKKQHACALGEFFSLCFYALWHLLSSMSATKIHALLPLIRRQ